MNNFLSKTKIILSGTILAVLVIVTWGFYLQLNLDKDSLSKNPILETRFFTILKTFKDESISFADISKSLTASFEDLSDTHATVTRLKNDGRVNPFAP